MSMIHENSRYPIFTLRKHTHAITSIEFVRIPIFQSTICKPYVITADEMGNIKLWDLKTHRVIKEINNAHQGSILSMKQLSNTNGGSNEPFVLTHSRDHTIKFWRLFDNKGIICLNEIYEMPVNALNFSNVDTFNHFLISANSSDSNKFDIYDLNFIYLTNTKHLTRIFEAIDLFKECQLQGFKFEEFNLRDNDENVNRIDKFGIVMKLIWIQNDLISVGYESGHIVIIKIDFKTKNLQILQISADHFPNPILSISYNKDTNILLTSSIKSKIIRHDLSNIFLKPEAIKVPINKISNIVTYKDKLILSSWSGFIKFFQTSNDFYYEEISQFKKPKGMLMANLNIIGNNNDDIEIQKQKIVKPNVLEVFIVDNDFVMENLDKQEKLDRRDLILMKKNYLCVGYDDGTVMVYDDI